jgi:hypothetical protein
MDHLVRGLLESTLSPQVFFSLNPHSTFPWIRKRISPARNSCFLAVVASRGRGRGVSRTSGGFNGGDEQSEVTRVGRPTRTGGWKSPASFNRSPSCGRATRKCPWSFTGAWWSYLRDWIGWWWLRVAGPPAPVALAGRCLAANLLRCGRARVSGYTKSEGSGKLLVSSPRRGSGWMGLVKGIAARRWWRSVVSVTPLVLLELKLGHDIICTRISLCVIHLECIH